MELQNRKILLIEDFSELREFFQRMLSKAGMDVVAVPTGYDGVEYFSHHREEIHLVITDLNLPGMDGFEVLERIRRIHWEVPVIALSAYADHAAFTQNGYMEQFDAVLSKPVDIAILQSTIHMVAEKKDIASIQ